MYKAPDLSNIKPIWENQTRAYWEALRQRIHIAEARLEDDEMLIMTYHRPNGEPLVVHDVALFKGVVIDFRCTNARDEQISVLVTGGNAELTVQRIKIDDDEPETPRRPIGFRQEGA